MSEQAAMSAVRQQMEKTRQHYMHAPPVFLDAWKEGVTMAGVGLFTAHGGLIKPQQVDLVINKWQLIPDLDAINKRCNTCSVGEGVFLGAMVSFYNSEIGASILANFGYSSLSDIANRLELEQLKVITKLMLNHTGW